jgi:FKBP-type peptidyl-prolyl cis-trans isomerase FkpA/FKBP-type peptidyl-prolyl cis-trans isomerase FklB
MIFSLDQGGRQTARSRHSFGEATALCDEATAFRDGAAVLLGLAKKSLALASLALIAWAAPTFAQEGSAQTDDEKAFYAIGASLAGQVMTLSPISDREFDLLVQGLRDGVAGRTTAAADEANRPRIRNLMQARQAGALEMEKAAAAAFLAAEAAKSGAKKTESGLVYTELRAGSGPSPTATDRVKVHYHGTLRDGTVFDSSVDRGKPAEFPLNRVIPCWTEGVAMMKVGGKARLICPAEIAYGNQRKGRIGPGAALNFEVELLEILK